VRGASVARGAAAAYVPGMGKVLALFLLTIMLVIVENTSLFWLLAIVEIASLFWDYHETVSIARNRGSGAPRPMLDEPGGVPTHVAPNENGTNRVYVSTDRRRPAGSSGASPSAVEIASVLGAELRHDDCLERRVKRPFQTAGRAFEA